MTSQRFAAFSEEGLRFLRSLKRNNNREWFLANKSIYEASVKKPMEDLVSALAADFASFAPEHVASPKTSIYRIYRHAVRKGQDTLQDPHRGNFPEKRIRKT